MMDLWSLFVENIFGGFWISIIGLLVVMAIILMSGGVSFLTVIIFSLFFILAMAIGYGHPIITIPLAIAIFGGFTFELIGLIESGGGQ